MKNLKYLFIIPSLSKGGAERVVSILASELTQQEREVVVITHFKAENEYPVNDNVKIICLSNLDEVTYRKKINIFFLSKLIIELRKQIKKENPDFIVPFLWTTCVRTDLALTGLKLKKRVIQTVRNNPDVFPKKYIMKKYRDYLVKKSNLTIVQNEQQKCYFQNNLWDKIKVLPNPVSPSLLDIDRHENKTKFKIIGVGRLEKQKNFDLLIDVVGTIIKSNVNVTLDIYGEGSMKSELQSHIDNLQLNKYIKLKGRSNDYFDIYGTASLFVLSSDFEGMPNTLLEAMAVGLPCISTNCPTGPAEIICSGKNGILVPVGDKDKMVQAINNLIQQDTLRSNIGKSAKQTIVQEYTPEKITCKFIEICESNIF